MRFGLFFFASYAGDSRPQLETVLKASRFADAAGFAFVSVPERHFDEFGGLFPNPAVMAAALAVATESIELRAGSLVAPLHNVLRMVEEWSVVDALSSGRVAISFGSGWNVNDFVLAPANYEGRRTLMLEQIEAFRAIWQNGRTVVTNPLGQEVTLSVFPRPTSVEPRIWITTSGSPDTFIAAGAIGANVLTHLENQDIITLGEKIRLYRESREAHGFDPTTGIVTLMQHTYVSEDKAAIDVAITDLTAYVTSALRLESRAVASGGSMSGQKQPGPGVLDPTSVRELIDEAVTRYVTRASLIGDVATCVSRTHELTRHGVDEIACLIDFVSDPSMLMRALVDLNRVRLHCEVSRQLSDREAAVRSFVTGEPQ